MFYDGDVNIYLKLSRIIKKVEKCICENIINSWKNKSICMLTFVSFPLSACNLSVVSSTFKVHFAIIFFIRKILFLHNYVLIILCVIYMLELKQSTDFLRARNSLHQLLY